MRKRLKYIWAIPIKKGRRSTKKTHAMVKQPDGSWLSLCGNMASQEVGISGEFDPVAFNGDTSYNGEVDYEDDRRCKKCMEVIEREARATGLIGRLWYVRKTGAMVAPKS